MRVLAIYDGTIQAKTALNYGIHKIKEKGGELIVLHVFQASLFIDYEGGLNAEKSARAEAKQHMIEAENIIREAGKNIPVRLITEEGYPEREILRIATAEKIDLILAAPRYKAIRKSSPCPVYIIPGTILVAADSADALFTDLDKITGEAKSTASKIVLLGIVPVHLYSREEKKELEEVTKKTYWTVKKIKKELNDRGLEVLEIMRSGYPDEEILKAAAEYGVSLIMLPGGGKTPSELAKAAAILLDEPDSAAMLIEVMETT